MELGSGTSEDTGGTGSGMLSREMGNVDTQADCSEDGVGIELKSTFTFCWSFEDFKFNEFWNNFFGKLTFSLGRDDLFGDPDLDLHLSSEEILVVDGEREVENLFFFSKNFGDKDFEHDLDDLLFVFLERCGDKDIVCDLDDFLLRFGLSNPCGDFGLDLCIEDFVLEFDLDPDLDRFTLCFDIDLERDLDPLPSFNLDLDLDLEYRCCLNLLVDLDLERTDLELVCDLGGGDSNFLVYFLDGSSLLPTSETV